MSTGLRGKRSRSEIVKLLLTRDGNMCMYPGCNQVFSEDNPPTIDHFWVPLSKGGTWDLDNLKLMHKTCNSAKGDIVPNPDGSLPEKPVKTRAVKVPRPPVCDTCANGRLLLVGEICQDCSSGPQPRSFPKTLQRRPKECDHAKYHCFMCVVGFYERKPVINILIEGP